MKASTFSRTGILIGLFLGIAALVGLSCQRNLMTEPVPNRVMQVPATFAGQTTDFAFEVFKRVNEAEGPAKNVFISPLSLHMALGMVLNGADGATAQEIQKTLKLDAQTLAEANQTYTYLLENLPKADSRVTLGLANSVWYRQGYSVEQTFQDVLRETFKAEIAGLDFGSATAKDRINGWADQQTNGRIKKVLDQVPPNSVMFLMNALYFKGDWKIPFDPGKTVDMPFLLPESGQKMVKMMRTTAEFRRTFHPAYTAFELPYGNGQFAMTVLLPQENITADAVLKSVSASEWSQLQKDMTAGPIAIGLPKFTLEYESKLNDILKSMGMPTAFTGAATFTKMNRNGGLFIDFVKQNTFVAVDEKGTEAAAVTTVGMVESLPPSAICNRPFVVIIHEKTSGTVLFMGKISNPHM
ncbi:serpin family protein [Nibrella saemangeumensis]|uniref:Serpin family protein n=1 Tax=Nibrella saemangeumensis TaxID=1084526 RepID=A0ABP8MEZ1_9BACT